MKFQYLLFFKKLKKETKLIPCLTYNIFHYSSQILTLIFPSKLNLFIELYILSSQTNFQNRRYRFNSASILTKNYIKNISGKIEKIQYPRQYLKNSKKNVSVKIINIPTKNLI